MNLPTWCPECGPKVDVNEDGCCVTCGASAAGRGAVTAHLAIIERDEARAFLDALSGSILELLPYAYDDGTGDEATAEECVEYAAEELKELRKERDEARAEVERLRADSDKWRDRYHAMRTDVGLSGDIEDETAAAYRRGAEAMREACLRDMDRFMDADSVYPFVMAHAIRGLPIPEEP